MRGFCEHPPEASATSKPSTCRPKAGSPPPQTERQKTRPRYMPTKTYQATKPKLCTVCKVPLSNGRRKQCPNATTCSTMCTEARRRGTSPLEAMKPEQTQPAPNPADQQPGSGLAGHWFHSIDMAGQLKWQGQVVASVEPEHHLVQLYSWIDGDPTTELLVTTKEMENWLFYKDSRAMQESYKNGEAKRYRTESN